MFPVKCYVVNPRPAYHTSLGADPIERQTDLLKKEIMRAAIRSAAASAGLQIGLMFAGPIGMAASTIISLVQYFTGQKYEKETKRTIEAAATAIKAAAAQATAEVDAEASQIFQQEFPAAQQLAASNIPLDGLGDFWSKARDKVKSTAKDVGRTVVKVSKVVSKATVQVVVVPFQVAAKGALQAASSVAKATGHEGTAKKLAKIRDQTDHVADRLIAYSDVEKTSELLSGREGYLVAKARAQKLRAKAIGEINAEKAQNLAIIRHPDFRLNVRIDTARGLRGDPSFATEQQVLDDSERHVMSILNQELTGADQALQVPALDASELTQPVQTANTAKLLVGGGLAAAALLFFNK